MSDAAEDDDDDAPKKKSKGMLFGLIGAVLLGGGAFYGVYSGLVPLPFGDEPKENPEVAESVENEDEDSAKLTDAPFDAGAFVAMEPILISLGERSTARHLKVTLSIEVEPGTEETVAAVKPRINDVLNTFLRAVDERDFEIPRSMARLRAQILRRVKLVSPPGSVRDVLVQEFILN